MLPFQNLRNVNVTHICSIYVFYKATLSLSRISHSTPFYDDFPLYGIPPHFKNFFASLPGEDTMLNLAEFGLLIARIMSQ